MKTAMTGEERRAALSLAAIVALRMLGLFLIFPVFALYAEGLTGVTPFLVGVAVGAYGLTQAMFQIPYGMLSDRIGRKPVIAAGLLLFAFGSVVAALSDSIWGVIAGRVIQGSGAVAAAVMALAADLTREEQRTKAMAIIGMTIGFAFMVALVLGPVLDHWIGVQGIFWLIGALALAGIALLFTVVPDPVDSHVHRDAQPVLGQFSRVLSDPGLVRLDFGILTLHMVLTALFLAVPLELRDLAGLAPARHWLVYLPVLVISVMFMIPMVIQAERHGRMRAVFVGAVALLMVAELGLAFGTDGLWSMALWLVVLFTGFNVLEATLPSLVSRVAPAASKGTAMGVYSTSQFAGAFIGGLLGGWLHHETGLQGIYLFGAVATALWIAVALGMRFPGSLSARLIYLPVPDDAAARQLEERLKAVPGVVEAKVVAEEGAGYLKVDTKRLDQSALDAITASPA